MNATSTGISHPQLPASLPCPERPRPRTTRIRRARAIWAAPVVLLIVAVMLGIASAAQAGGTLSVPGAAAWASSNDQSMLAMIDRDVAQGMASTRLPGLALGIVKGNQLVHLKAFGQADDHSRAATVDTPFYIGSNSKSFTAVAVMQLVESGQVDLDAPVQRYIPWFRIADPAASAAITIRMLLNQTSGLGDWEDYFWPANSTSTALSNAVRSMSRLKTQHPIGTTFEYASVNFTILGQLVATVSGQPYETYVRQHILTPLDMTHTYLDLATAQRHGLATQHQYWFDQPTAGGGLPYNRAVTPAGLVISTARDMSHYLIAQLNGGRYGDHRILSPSGIAELHRGKAAIGGTDSYAMVGSPVPAWTTSSSSGTAATPAGPTPIWRSFPRPDGEWSC